MTDSSTATPQDGGAALDPEQVRLGARLKESREYLGLSQKFVADRTGIPRSAISDVERGVRKVDSLELKKFALVYTRPIGYFLDEDENADPSRHTVQVVTRRLGGMSAEDLAKVADYVEMVEVRARMQSQAKS